MDELRETIHDADVFSCVYLKHKDLRDKYNVSLDALRKEHSLLQDIVSDIIIQHGQLIQSASTEQGISSGSMDLYTKKFQDIKRLINVKKRLFLMLYTNFRNLRKKQFFTETLLDTAGKAGDEFSALYLASLKHKDILAERIKTKVECCCDSALLAIAECVKLTRKPRLLVSLTLLCLHWVTRGIFRILLFVAHPNKGYCRRYRVNLRTS